MWRTFPFSESEVCCQKTSLSFADSIWESFGPLLRGIPLLIGRPFAVRPGTPPDRIAILREAFVKTIADPQFLAEAKSAKIDMEYVSPQAVLAGFNEMVNQPPNVLEAMAKYLQPAE